MCFFVIEVRLWRVNIKKVVSVEKPSDLQIRLYIRKLDYISVEAMCVRKSPLAIHPKMCLSDLTVDTKHMRIKNM